MENEKNLEEVQQETVPAEEAAPIEETAEPAAEETAAAEEVTAEDPAAEEAAAEEPAAEEAPAEEAAFEKTTPEEKKATPGKLALLVGAIVVVAAVIVALLMGGTKTEEPAAEVQPTLDTTVVETQPEPTIPADGNPDDETCKGTYTVTDEEVKAAADTVVATLGDHTLTNAQLQVFYWMQVQNFLSSDYGSYMLYYGMMDYTQPLETQTSMMGSGTWQQFFLKEALTTWRNYCVLADQAKAAEMTLTAEEQEYLDTLEESLTSAAQYYGLESVEDLLYRLVGAGAGMEEYKYFQELLGYGNLYYDAEYAKLDPTMEEMEAYFAENEAALAENGITKEGKLVDVRHVLFTPEGGTTDESGVTTYSEEEWAACEAEAQDVLNAWTKKGDLSEESFAALAAAYSEDPGSKDNGGLYEGVYEGQMVEEFENWCFDESRKSGHYGMVKTTYGYHLMYFVDATPIWEEYVDQQLMAQKATAMMEAIVADYTLDVDYSAIVLGYVDMAA